MIVVLTLGLAYPAVTHAYVENEYVNEIGNKQNQEAIEREKEREVAATAKAEQETAAKAAAERGREEARIAEERKSQEEKEQAEKEVVERQARRVREESQKPQCVVPSLKGDTLRKARRVLGGAHCRLGSVVQPRCRHKGALRVTHQQSPRGKRLLGGARVGVTLGFTMGRKHN
ncbi:MAG TPA: hypothetical protein VIJ33_09180 [Solirubrobacteraceae bacterium]